MILTSTRIVIDQRPLAHSGDIDREKEKLAEKEKNKPEAMRRLRMEEGGR